jgi:hypothetical protein|tara:strand:+ start:433 stop:993 length:561 start_codon:yes stop_codon:yes gene_type:complete
MTSKLKTDILETVSGSGTIALTNQLSGMTSASMPSGSVIQVKNFQTSAVITGTGHIPNDNTTPLNSEGFEVMSLAITPTSATSTLIIEVIAITSHTHDVIQYAALFQDLASVAKASTMQYFNQTYSNITQVFTHKMTAGTTSSTTFKLRVGGHGASTGTTTFNGRSSAGRLGGTLSSSITITEIKG